MLADNVGLNGIAGKAEGYEFIHTKEIQNTCNNVSTSSSV